MWRRHRTGPPGDCPRPPRAGGESLQVRSTHPLAARGTGVLAVVGKPSPVEKQEGASDRKGRTGNQELESDSGHLREPPTGTWPGGRTYSGSGSRAELREPGSARRQVWGNPAHGFTRISHVTNPPRESTDGSGSRYAPDGKHPLGAAAFPPRAVSRRLREHGVRHPPQVTLAAPEGVAGPRCCLPGRSGRGAGSTRRLRSTRSRRNQRQGRGPEPSGGPKAAPVHWAPCTPPPTPEVSQVTSRDGLSLPSGPAPSHCPHRRPAGRVGTVSGKAWSRRRSRAPSAGPRPHTGGVSAGPWAPCGCLARWGGGPPARQPVLPSGAAPARPRRVA